MDKKQAYNNITDDKQRLFFGSLSDIANVLGHSLHNPVSISLLCLELGITNNEQEKLDVAFYNIIDSNEEDQLSVPIFRKVIEDIVPSAKEFTDAVVIALIKAFARNNIPELEPFARPLSTLVL